MDKEKVLLWAIYKHNGQWKTEGTRDCKDYELYGFLKIFLKNFEKNLQDDIGPREDNEDLID